MAGEQGAEVAERVRELLRDDARLAPDERGGDWAAPPVEPAHQAYARFAGADAEPLVRRCLESFDLGVAWAHLDEDVRLIVERLNEKLRGLAERTGAPVIYAIDRQGRTVSASNVGQPDSFVGRNYNFRPYFLALFLQRLKR